MTAFKESFTLKINNINKEFYREDKTNRITDSIRNTSVYFRKIPPRTIGPP